VARSIRRASSLGLQKGDSANPVQRGMGGDAHGVAAMAWPRLAVEDEVHVAVVPAAREDLEGVR
jgi:hypothetical protein